MLTADAPSFTTTTAETLSPARLCAAFCVLSFVGQAGGLSYGSPNTMMVEPAVIPTYCFPSMA